MDEFANSNRLKLTMLPAQLLNGHPTSYSRKDHLLAGLKNIFALLGEA